MEGVWDTEKRKKKRKKKEEKKKKKCREQRGEKNRIRRVGVYKRNKTKSEA